MTSVPASLPFSLTVAVVMTVTLMWVSEWEFGDSTLFLSLRKNLHLSSKSEIKYVI